MRRAVIITNSCVWYRKKRKKENGVKRIKEKFEKRNDRRYRTIQLRKHQNIGDKENYTTWECCWWASTYIEEEKKKKVKSTSEEQENF